jgi:hypothetical protein
MTSHRESSLVSGHSETSFCAWAREPFVGSTKTGRRIKLPFLGDWITHYLSRRNTPLRPPAAIASAQPGKFKRSPTPRPVSVFGNTPVSLFGEFMLQKLKRSIKLKIK